MKIQKSEYFENVKSFLDETKNIFHNYLTIIIQWKKKQRTQALVFNLLPTSVCLSTEKEDIKKWEISFEQLWKSEINDVHVAFRSIGHKAHFFPHILRLTESGNMLRYCSISFHI